MTKQKEVADEEKFHLISLIRNKPAIWDAPPGLPRKNRSNEFISIAEEMTKTYQREFSAELIRYTWRVLNICFSRERKKPSSGWKFLKEMSSFITKDTPKRKMNDKSNIKTKKKLKKEERLPEENENKNEEEEELDLLNSFVDNFNDGTLTTDENSNLTMLDDNEFEDNGEVVNDNNIEDRGNEGLEIIEDVHSDKVVENPINNNIINDDDTGSIATAIIHENPNKAIDTNKTLENILENTNEDDSLLLGKMVVCTHRALKAEGMDCEAIDFEKSIYELLINYKQMKANNANKNNNEDENFNKIKRK